MLDTLITLAAMTVAVAVSITAVAVVVHVARFLITLWRNIRS